MDIKDWFNSVYYHVLYSNRNDDEAKTFISNILKYLKPELNSCVWDLCCGNGRHSDVLAKNGLKVTGTDASENNIHSAIERNLKNTEFYVHDMRNLFRSNAFDYVFNLFTSFGYFDNARDDERVFINVFKALKPNGIFVIDFLNPSCVLKNLVKHEIIEKNNLHFQIERSFDGVFIRKKITVTDQQNTNIFEEKVKALTSDQLQTIGQKAGLKTVEVFGNYQLEKFNEHSPRCILIFKK